MSATIVPAGELQQPYLLKWLVASCPTFQEIVGTSEANEAAQHAHFPATLQNEEKHAPPWAIINPEADYSVRQTTLATWVNRGNLYLSFDFWVPREYKTQEDRCSWFLLKVGKIITEMRDLATARGEGPIAGQTHLDVISISSAPGVPFEVDADELDLINADKAYADQALWHHHFEVEYR